MILITSFILSWICSWGRSLHFWASRGCIRSGRCAGTRSRRSHLLSWNLTCRGCRNHPMNHLRMLIFSGTVFSSSWILVWVSAIRRNLEADLDLGFPGAGLEVGVEKGVDLGVGWTQVGHLDRGRAEIPFAKLTVVVVFVRVEGKLEVGDFDYLQEYIPAYSNSEELDLMADLVWEQRGWAAAPSGYF